MTASAPSSSGGLISVPTVSGQVSRLTMATEIKTDAVELREQPLARPNSTRADRPAIIQAWHINRRLMVWSLAVACVLMPASYFWYKLQVRRHAAAIFEHAQGRYQGRAGAAPLDGVPPVSATPSPRCKKALLMRAQAYDKQASDAERLPRTTALFFQAIQANPQRHDIRLRLAAVLFATRRYDEAADHADQVSLEASPTT